MKIRPAYISTAKVAVVGLLGWGAYQGWTAFKLSQFEFKSLAPTSVALIAVSPESGYGVQVSNSVARLVQGQTQFGAPEKRDETGGDDKSKQNIIPIRDMVLAMQGDEVALGNFVMRLNNLDENDLPPVRHVWTPNDLERAILGDEILRKKLEGQLNVTLGGEPLSTIDPSALEYGIVLDIPVPIKLKVGSNVKTLQAHVLEAFRPQFPQIVMKGLEDNANVTDQTILAEYLREAKVMREKALLENVAESLRSRYSQERLTKLATKPELVLAHTETILTTKHLTGGRIETEEDTAGTIKYTLQLGVTEEGRMRLWKYSRTQREYQLLLVSNGIAVAAPRIEGEVFSHDLAIRNLTDEPLARKTAELIEKLKGN